MDDEYDNDDEYEYEEDGMDYEYDEDMEEGNSEGNTTVQSRASPTESGPAASADKKSSATKSVVVQIDGYSIVDLSDVEELMAKRITEVSGLLDLNGNVAQALLQHYKWNKEKLIDAFFADSEKVLKDTGVDMAVARPCSANKGPYQCKICYDDSDNLLSLGCGHKFCSDCYAQYLETQVKDGPPCIIARCPEHKCTQIVTRDLFAKLLKDKKAEPRPEPTTSTTAAASTNASSKVASATSSGTVTPIGKGANPNGSGGAPLSTPNAVTPGKDFAMDNSDTVLQQYEKYFVRNFVETCKDMKYCPAPGCNKVAVGSGVTNVKCTCGNPFCMRCGEEAHEPVSCVQLGTWQEKCQNESETANWILANTRKCPNCSSRIEKNQGCNHMTCKICRHEFCWICLGIWKEHTDNYKCNKFLPSEMRTQMDKAKAELDRYLHYYKRYVGHNDACKFANKQRIIAEQKMTEQQVSHHSTWIEVQYLKQAVEQVIDCRRVLKYTYVLGFFLNEDSAEKKLFEHHQEMLEKNTDKLQELTEQSMESIERLQVVNLTRITEKFMASLLATMMGGVVIMDRDVLGDVGLPTSSTSSSGAGAKAEGGGPSNSATTPARATRSTSKGKK